MRCTFACVAVLSFVAVGPVALAQEEASATAATSETGGSGVVAAIAAGGVLQRLFDVPVMGLEAIGSLGGRVVGVEGTLLLGRTQYGLGYERGTVGLAIGSREGAWGFGLSPYLGYLSISRHTNPADPLVGGTLGVSVHTSWDFVSWNHSAFFALARITGEFGALPILGVDLAIGYRFGP
jgi:hypothetical protein